MKKIFLAAALAVLTILNVSAQKKAFEGTVTYAISFEGSVVTLSFILDHLQN